MYKLVKFVALQFGLLPNGYFQNIQESFGFTSKYVRLKGDGSRGMLLVARYIFLFTGDLANLSTGIWFGTE